MLSEHLGPKVWMNREQKREVVISTSSAAGQSELSLKWTKILPHEFGHAAQRARRTDHIIPTQQRFCDISLLFALFLKNRNIY